MQQIFTGDCLKVMPTLPSNSVHLVLCDLPYGVTACKWDSVLPLFELWEQYRRVVVDDGAIVLTATQPFTTTLIASNYRMFRYSWVWEKNFSTNFFHAKRMPLRKTEDILVFSKKPCRYFPQKTDGHVPTQSAKGKSHGVVYHGTNTRDYVGGDTTRYPTNILRFNAVDPKLRIHPTQKPLGLLEYLVMTYSLDGETVLDNCMGSGSTGIAALKHGRRFIGIENDSEMAAIATHRILATDNAESNGGVSHPTRTPG